MTDTGHTSTPTPENSVSPTPQEKKQPAPKSAKKPRKKKSKKAPYPVRQFTPGAATKLLEKHPSQHPGLLLAKHALLLKGRGKHLDLSQGASLQQLQAVAKALETTEVQNQWQNANQLRQTAFEHLKVQTVKAQSQSSSVFQTSHLFQSKGLNYHSIHGFPVILGKDIKGALKQYMLSTAQDADPEQHQALVDRIFGTRSQQGDIVFHDAWPEKWPEVQVLVLSNHYADYYNHRKAPADWQVPEPEFCMALKAGAEFAFPIQKSHAGVSDTLVESVQTWLTQCLALNGLGTYQHNGYGIWHAEGYQPPEKTGHTYGLKLESPAFLGGALPEVQACELTPASLRGALRYWWRTLHAGYLDLKTLHRLETAIWGGAHKKGALRLDLRPQQTHRGYRLKWPMLAHQLPQFEDERQKGIDYLLHGLKDENRRSYFLLHELKWTLHVAINDVPFKPKHLKTEPITLSEELLKQSLEGALALLCHFGGLGARHRKGFGSFSSPDLPLLDLQQLGEQAHALRAHCGLKSEFKPQWQSSPVHEQVMHMQVQTPWKSPWFVLHQVGAAMQAYALENKHKGHKMLLGTPRKIGTPIFNPPTLSLQAEQRHASPFRVSLHQQESGYTLTLSAYPSPDLPNLEESKAYLENYLKAVEAHLLQAIGERVEPEVTYPQTKPREQRRGPKRERGPRPERSDRSDRERKGKERSAFKDRKDRKGRPPKGGKGKYGDKAVRLPGNKPSKPQAGGRLQATLLEEKTKKGGWKALDPKSKLSGPIVNTALVSGEVGDSVELIIHAVNQFEMLFRWPTEADNKPPKAPKKRKPKGFFD